MQQNPYLEAVHTKSDNVINYLGGGISNIYPAQFIQDDEAQDMYNMCLDSYPAIRTRIGRTMLKNPGLKGEKIKYYRAFNERDEALYVIRKIKELINKGVDYQDIAVLYRTNAQSRVLEEEMLKENDTGLEKNEEIKSAKNVEPDEKADAKNVESGEDEKKIEPDSEEQEPDFEDCDIIGDLVISIPKVYEQAEEYGHSFERELSYMCVHGFYHLMGYDHIKDEDKAEMRKKEDEILNKLGITRD